MRYDSSAATATSKMLEPGWIVDPTFRICVKEEFSRVWPELLLELQEYLCVCSHSHHFDGSFLQVWQGRRKLENAYRKFTDSIISVYATAVFIMYYDTVVRVINHFDDSVQKESLVVVFEKGRSIAIDKRTETPWVGNEVGFGAELIECQIIHRNSKDKAAGLRRLCDPPVCDVSIPIITGVVQAPRSTNPTPTILQPPVLPCSSLVSSRFSLIRHAYFGAGSHSAGSPPASLERSSYFSSYSSSESE